MPGGGVACASFAARLAILFCSRRSALARCFSCRFISEPPSPSLPLPGNPPDAIEGDSAARNDTVEVGMMDAPLGYRSCLHTHPGIPSRQLERRESEKPNGHQSGNMGEKTADRYIILSCRYVTSTLSTASS